MTEENHDWQRHTDLYISDGTMVFLADSTLFRIYAGLLSRHSVVFEGLIDSSKYLPEDAEVYDGCPLVRLQDDPDDFAHFLKAMLNLCPFERGLPTSYPIASAVLRLSSKYMVQFLRQRAVEHFKRIIPQSYDEIGKEESYTQVFGPNKAGWPHHFQLLTLFRDHRLMTLLPWTYYSACTLGFEKLLQGDTTRGGRKIRLDACDIPIALLGWKSLCQKTYEVCNNIIRSRDPKCVANCNVLWTRGYTFEFETQAMIQWKMFKILDYPLGQVLPTDLVLENTWINTYGRPCQHCNKEWSQREKEARAAIWPTLPAIFKLPDWETLENEEKL